MSCTISALFVDLETMQKVKAGQFFQFHCSKRIKSQRNLKTQYQHDTH